MLWDAFLQKVDKEKLDEANYRAIPKELNAQSGQQLWICSLTYNGIVYIKCMCKIGLVDAYIYFPSSFSELELLCNQLKAKIKFF